MDRIEVLLKAALELLKENKDKIEGTARYDEANCDVHCLIEDIEIELDLG